MTVGELKKALEKVPDDRLVVCSRDAEGNGYSPLYEVDDDNICEAGDGWVSDMNSLSWTAGQAAMTESQWEAFKANGTRAIVLWPIG